MKIEVTNESVITSTDDFGNGAGPLWCYGSPTIVRSGNTLYCTAPEVGAGVEPLCNTRWNLYRKQGEAAWERVAVSPAFNEREPCPMILFPDGHPVISVNPAVEGRGVLDDGRKTWTCEPRLQVFDPADPTASDTVIPDWHLNHPFTEHSYRGIGADPTTGSALLVQQAVEPATGITDQTWTYLDEQGDWRTGGYLTFPMRGCYPQVAVRGKAAYVMAVSDEVEPVIEWRDYKRQITERQWDYEFRQIFFTWTPDITTRSFSPPLTVAARDETAGQMRNVDLWIDDAGGAHLLYIERSIWHAFLRDRFFPGNPIRIALKYAHVVDGRVVRRLTLHAFEEDPSTIPTSPRDVVYEIERRAPAVTWAAFQPTPEGRLFVVWHQSGGNSNGTFVQPLLPDPGAIVAVPLEHPLRQFFNCSQRSGVQPSDSVDLYGIPASGEKHLRHAQFRIS